MLDANLQSQLKTYLERVTRPIQITAHADDGAKSQEMLELLETLVSLSSQITLDVRRDGAERTPSFALTTPGQDIHLAFAGLPMGHEFTSLVLALLQVGGHPSKATAEVIEQVQGLEGEYRFETYFSLSCQNCPDVVQALNLAAVLNPRIQHVAIDGGLFPAEVEARQIMSVPTVYLNGEVFDQGRMSLEQIVAKLDTGSAKRDAAKIAAKAPYDVLVIGGGPAGAAAAIYAARKGIRTGVAAERFGGQVLDTMAIENFISVKETEGPKLAMALEQHVREYDVDIMNLQRASGLVPAGDDGLVEIKLENGASLKSRSVILSTGARWRQMNVPGEDQYRNKGVAYCPHCDGPLFKGKRVAVIGGGNSGVEAAIDLAGIVTHVTLLEFDDKLRADEVLQKKLRSLGNVTIITSALTQEVLGDGQKVNGLVYKDRVGGDAHRVELEGIFVQIGLLPNTEWLKDAVALSPRGEVVIDDRGQTSVPGVFAAGDCTTVPYKQIIIAMGAGSTAALSAFDHLIRTTVPKSSGAVAEAA
ncbi:alkyl hydroperoxide reductase subunit F [Stenotrophomonas rhizophila]|jgi:alkyl hydroperoxide reductase subunit F|uniref:Alkyl hydroperoxide reductase subunit F n=1 Tax=Stenotrophomonas rhizophila TaxID=216778 RepID=A0AAP5EBF3_9GAMM|nr:MULTISPECIES: alkyl hydroperoxide reductase subunit F [Stenotrophomonas]HDS0921675.1 alkyl hydroperoxide reductase subunit F [Stenotrophomonas maltophilia]MDQ1063776.1 alkyl hydroperoxide reductase subunit F [Stenotrophomonas sp. SORGH_AS_0282]MDQ1109760.1 alkyl hydroperoxide reductase subunit F [Stenotrophomonas rhizophila]MDQ1187857.1 alkyl hydroperoxide reductase subunit F [Stenotrophomonas sp. SORGH_AS_0282]MDY0981944.1 alkyl hydroperoxide reductase subunit F [Stenotrophomonas sp. CFBP8